MTSPTSQNNPPICNFSKMFDLINNIWDAYMKSSELLKEIRAKFMQELQTKNSWGKNEIERLYDTVVREVLESHLD